MKMNTNIKKVFALLFCAGTLASCSSDPEKPGRTFMPDMAYSQAYETYSENPNFSDSTSARLPVEGTISRGMLPEKYTASEKDESYHVSYLYKRYYKDNNDDYERAGRELSNPFEPSDDILKSAKLIYNTNCKVCHGEKGAGDGSIVESGAYPPVPAYEDRLPKIAEGQMFHSIVYGKNLMGSYSSQLSVDEIWKVIFYIQQLAEVEPFEKEGSEDSESEDKEEDKEEESSVASN